MAWVSARNPEQIASPREPRLGILLLYNNNFDPLANQARKFRQELACRHPSEASRHADNLPQSADKLLQTADKLPQAADMLPELADNLLKLAANLQAAAAKYSWIAGYYNVIRAESRNLSARLTFSSNRLGEGTDTTIRLTKRAWCTLWLNPKPAPTPATV